MYGNNPYTLHSKEKISSGKQLIWHAQPIIPKNMVAYCNKNVNGIELQSMSFALTIFQAYKTINKYFSFFDWGSQQNEFPYRINQSINSIFHSVLIGKVIPGRINIQTYRVIL